MHGEDFYDYFIQNHLAIGTHETLKILRQILNALHHLHSVVGHAHLDLKFENFVIDEDTKALKLIDFGNSEEVDTLGETMKGTINYTPPEVAKHNKGISSGARGDKADMWSLGILLFALAFKAMPFKEDLVNWRVIY